MRTLVPQLSTRGSAVAPFRAPTTLARTLERQIEEIMAQAAPRRQPEGDARRVVTILFSRISGYVGLCELLEPYEVASILDVYQRMVTDSVGQFLGTIHGAMGATIMVGWNTGRPQVEHAMLAVNAAIEVLERIGDVNQRLDASGFSKIACSIGLNTGDAVIRSIASPRRESDVIGDSVNIAHLLSQISSPDCILMGEGTRVSVGEQIAAEDMGVLNLPGKSKLVRAYRVIGRLTLLPES